jgi:PAS domain S-box-containing protein
LEKQVRNLLFIIKIIPSLIILIVSVLIINILNIHQQKELKEEHKIIEKQFIDDQKNRIKNTISTVHNLIKEENINIEIELKKKLKYDVENIYRIMNTIYKRNINKKSKNEILEEIKIVLRDLRFNNGRTYVALANSKGVVVLQPLKPQIEDISAYNLKDHQGKYIMREIISLAQSKKAEGYAEYYFSKPSDKNNEYKKLSFIKAFKKLDLIIVVGDYIEDYKLDVQNKMLKQFPKLKYKEGGHIYIITFDGDIIYHPSKKAMNTNIFKEDKYNHMDYLFKDLISKEEKDSGTFMSIKPKVVVSENTKEIKINYVKRFDDWGWMIGLNFNISDANPIIKKRKEILEKKYTNYKSDILFYGVIFTLIMLILSYFISKLLERKFLNYKKNLEKQITENETQNKKLKIQSTLLEQKKIELETIIKEAPNPIIIHNEDGKIIMLNQAWVESSGFNLENTPTIDMWIEYTQKNERNRASILEHIYSLYDITEKLNEGEFTFTNKNGSLVTWQFSSAPLGIIDTKRTIISSAMDITELKQKEKLLFEQSKMASMGEMIGNIAHQWRQPLSVISTGVTGMKLQKEYGLLDDKLFYNTCDAINDNAQYLSKTIDDFKNFSKGDRTKKIFNLTNNIDSFLHLVEGTIKKNNISIILNLNNTIKVNGYENELTQCLINIFNNAKDALLGSKIEDRLFFIETVVDKNNIMIKLRDNAGGVPKDVLARIFEPYFTTKHKSQGTGLGLSMTYTFIVDGMKGKIEFENVNFKYNDKHYKGGEVIITLPIS